MPLLPDVNLLLNVRWFLKNERPMIAKTIADCKTMVEAGKVFLADVSGIIDIVNGMFNASPPSPGPLMGAEDEPMFEDGLTFRQRHVVDRVKRHAERIHREDAFSITGPDGASRSVSPDAKFSIEAVWGEAVDAGIHQVIFDELNKVEGFQAVMGEVHGKVIDWLKSAWAWALAHQDQLIAIGKVILAFLMMLGLL